MHVAPAKSAAAVLPPGRLERRALWALLAVVIVFGGIVEMRSAFLKRRMTDADVYFRAAWAVREGVDIYSVTDTNGWHYHYPPLLAIALAPLANPPPGAERAGYLPYPVSVAVWFVINVVLAWLSVHWLAAGLARAGPERWAFPVYSRGWWAIRVLPLLVMVVLVGNTLSRGQSNMVMLAFLCGMGALLVQNRSFAAGLCLAGAICIKIFPAFLLIHPVVRRDFRCLTGAAAGLLIGVVIVPAAALGPAGAVEAYRRIDAAVLRPGIGVGRDMSRHGELMQGIGSQAFKFVLRNTLHPNRETRPRDVGPAIRAGHWAIAAVLTLVTIAVGLRRRRGDHISELLFLGSLIVIMLPMNPAAHIHNFVLGIPLVAALICGAWEQHGFPRIGRGMWWLFGFVIAANVVTPLPFHDHLLRDLGLPLYAALALWVAGLRMMHQRRRAAITSS